MISTGSSHADRASPEAMLAHFETLSTTARDHAMRVTSSRTSSSATRPVPEEWDQIQNIMSRALPFTEDLSYLQRL